MFVHIYGCKKYLPYLNNVNSCTRNVVTNIALSTHMFYIRE